MEMIDIEKKLKIIDIEKKMKIWVIVMITPRMMILLTNSFPTKLVVVCAEVKLELSEIWKPRFLKWWKNVKEKKIPK